MARLVTMSMDAYRPRLSRNPARNKNRRLRDGIVEASEKGSEMGPGTSLRSQPLKWVSDAPFRCLGFRL